MGIALTNKELEFETKMTNAKVHRMNKLNEKRNLYKEIIIILFFVFLFCAFITSLIWQSWQMVFYCGFGVVCLIGLINEQIYEKRRTEILNSFQGPIRI